jgi:hypothetical protein
VIGNDIVTCVWKPSETGSNSALRSSAIQNTTSIGLADCSLDKKSAAAAPAAAATTAQANTLARCMSIS